MIYNQCKQTPKERRASVDGVYYFLTMTPSLFEYAMPDGISPFSGFVTYKKIARIKFYYLNLIKFCVKRSTILMK